MSQFTRIEMTAAICYFLTFTKTDFHFLSNATEYDRGDSFPFFQIERNARAKQTEFHLVYKEKLSIINTIAYSFQFEARN